MMRQAARPTGARARFIDPTVLARIDNLDLVARTVVEGFIGGLHRSPFLGLSIDFAEHRAYMPGDDIRRIDWRLFGRTDRFYLKEFEADTNTNMSVLLDVSRSMDFGSHAVTKLQYASFVAASLTYLSSRQRDRVGLMTFADKPVDVVPPSAKHLDLVLHGLARARAEQAGDVVTALPRLAEHFRRRGVLIVLSDLYADPEAAVRAVLSLRHHGNDVIVFHVLDPAERRFDYDDAMQFEDLESGDRLVVVPEAVRQGYRDAVAAHVATLQRRFADHRVDYAVLDTSEPLDHALFAYLNNRQRASRVR